ncbi:hypothetical protein AX14_014047 [Amanita brunnescens Koide BX004]|nr:hypothetical protein AX14_014047 [Amanita brunnescens Koide BX004]
MSNLKEDDTTVEKVWVVLYQIFSLISLWSSRLSTAVIIVWLCPQGTTMCAVFKRVAVLFGITAFALILYKTVKCGLGNGRGIEICGFGPTIAVVETSCNIIADSWLTGASIHMVSDMNLSGQHYWILVAIFTSNLLTSFASMVHSILSLLSKSQASFIAGTAQCATSLFVCNLLVIVTSLYRRIWGSAEAAIRSRARHSPAESSERVMIEMTMVSIENRSASGAHPNFHWGCGSLGPPPPAGDLTPTSTFPDLPQSRRPVETIMDAF